MPVDRTERRAALRAWLMTGVGPGTTRGIDTQPGDLEAFRRHNIAGGVPRIRRLVMVLLLLNGLAWTTDDVLLAVIPGVEPALWQGRALMTAFGLAVIGFSWLPITRRAAGAVALGWIGTFGLCAGVAWTVGRIGGPSTSWYHSTYVFLFSVLLAWASPLHRIVHLVALVAVILAVYFGPHPQHLADPLAASAISHLLFVAAMVLIIALRLDASRLRLYFFKRAAARQSERLAWQVEQQTARIQGLLDHVERAREDERREIAAELHDEMGQVLTGMRLSLRVARTRARADGNPLTGAIEQLGEMMQHLGWAVRNLLVRLRPRVLDDLGFVAAAEWLARRTDELPGVRCSFAADPALPELHGDAATAGFRVLQEALTNAVRHGRPAQIAVRLAGVGPRVRLSVEDDGVGFDPSSVGATGMGLLGMRERARARGGRFEIHSAPGAGTRVVLVLPARPSDAIADAMADPSMPSKVSSLEGEDP